MSRFKLTAWAVAILAGGVLLALPFRRSAPVPAQPPLKVTEDLKRQAEAVTLQVAPSPIAVPSSRLDRAAPIATVGKEAQAPSRAEATDHLSAVVAVPVLADDRKAVAKFTPPAIPPTVISEAPQTHERAEPTARPREHRIVDGDTLPLIARRYLKDPDRWPEIYRLNPGVLTDPDLLPIGKRILIPPHGAATSVATAVESAPKPPPAPPTPAVPEHLVPVPLDAFRSGLP